MPLAIESGVGIAGAQAYADLSSLSAWLSDTHGEPAPDQSPGEAAILRAILYMEGLAWKGVRAGGRSQALAWPRSGVTDGDGLAVGAAEIPAQIITAQHVLARAELASPGVLSPTVLPGARVKRQRVDVLETEYAVDPGDSDRALVTGALDLLKGYLRVDDVEVAGGTPLKLGSLLI